MTARSRADFHNNIVLKLTGEQQGSPVLLWSSLGQGKTSTLRALTSLIQKKTGWLQIFMPLHDICFSPEFFEKHAAAIIRNSLDANAVGLSDTFQRALEARKGQMLRVFPALNDVAREEGVEILLMADEISDLLVLKSYPGHSDVFSRFCSEYVKGSQLRFLFTSAFRRRVTNAFEAAGLDFQTAMVPALSIAEIKNTLAESGFGAFRDLAPEIFFLTQGNHAYVRAFIDHALRGEPPITMDTVVSSLRENAALEMKCRFNYEYLVGKSRGEGVIRYLLASMSSLDMPNLTAIARSIDRSLGVTKDYLKWMLDVGIIEVEKKRYYFPDDLLKTWIRLYRSGSRPSRQRIEEEINAILNEGIERLNEMPRESETADSTDDDATVSSPLDEINLPDLSGTRE